MSESKVYLLSAGEYSDYRVHAAFSTKAAAEAFLGGSVEYYIEEIDLDPVRLTQVPRFKVEMNKNGDVIETENITNPFDEEIEATEHVAYWSYSAKLDHRKWYFIVYCHADDERQAIKIANERRLIAIANDEMEVDPIPDGFVRVTQTEFYKRFLHRDATRGRTGWFHSDKEGICAYMRDDGEFWMRANLAEG